MEARQGWFCDGKAVGARQVRCVKMIFGEGIPR